MVGEGLEIRSVFPWIHAERAAGPLRATSRRRYSLSILLHRIPRHLNRQLIPPPRTRADNSSKSFSHPPRDGVTDAVPAASRRTRPASGPPDASPLYQPSVDATHSPHVELHDAACSAERPRVFLPLAGPVVPWRWRLLPDALVGHALCGVAEFVRFGLVHPRSTAVLTAHYD